jgi:hypothetical protein
MYEKLPFDKPEIITKLGTKSFTRIKKEDQQRVIWEFLLEQPVSGDPSRRRQCIPVSSLYFVNIRYRSIVMKNMSVTSSS